MARLGVFPVSCDPSLVLHMGGGSVVIKRRLDNRCHSSGSVKGGISSEY